MNYYRPATEDDFSEPEILYPNYSKLDDNTKELIKQGELHKAIKGIMNKTGMGVNDSRKYCMKYQKYTQAKQDFANGLSVFVKY